MSNFSFNIDANAIKRIAEDEVRDVAAKQTRALERLRQRYTGHPVAEVKPELQRMFPADGGTVTVTEPELTQWAEMISAWKRIEVKFEKIRW